MKAVFLAILRVGLATALAAGAVCSYAQEPLKQDTIFPIALYNHRSQTTVQRMIEVMANGVDPLAVSSNPDIESNYLVGKDCFIIIAVNRKREDEATEIQCFRPPFAPEQVRGLISGEELPFR